MEEETRLLEVEPRLFRLMMTSRDRVAVGFLHLVNCPRPEEGCRLLVNYHHLGDYHRRDSSRRLGEGCPRLDSCRLRRDRCSLEDFRRPVNSHLRRVTLRMGFRRVGWGFRRLYLGERYHRRIIITENRFRCNLDGRRDMALRAMVDLHRDTERRLLGTELRRAMVRLRRDMGERRRLDMEGCRRRGWVWDLDMEGWGLDIRVWVHMGWVRRHRIRVGRLIPTWGRRIPT